mmetsp:Transcript_2058/g.7403  ORF Transcript_2058/g.7403 Transcript_2058/m.7403 type:complete len:121 (-) Transcript_2058:159-521(-)
MCFSVVNPASYDNVSSKWAIEINEHNPDTPIVLCGTKVDLRDDPRSIAELEQNGQQPISIKMGDKKAKEIGAVAYCECSAKTGQGLKDVFDEAIKAVLFSKGRKGKGKGKGKGGGGCMLL